MIEDGRVATQGTGTWEGTLMGGHRGQSQPTQLRLALPTTPQLLPELLQLPPLCNQSLAVASETGRRPQVNRAALGGPGAPQPFPYSPSLVMCLGAEAEAP